MPATHDNTTRDERRCPRPANERMAAWYRRKRAGRFCASVEITPADTAFLASLGLLARESARDKVAVSVALGRLLTLLQRQVQPGSDASDRQPATEFHDAQPELNG